MYKIAKSPGFIDLIEGDQVTTIPTTGDHYLYRQYLDWLAQGNTPEPFETPSEHIARRKREKLAEINAAFQAELDQYAGSYPEYEKLTWETQKNESAAWVAWDEAARVAPEPATPRLDGIATRRGVDREELIRRANAKAVLFAQVSDDAIGKRQRLEDQVAVAQSQADLDNIKW